MSKNIEATLGGVQLRDFSVPFIEEPLEDATDVVTLDGTIYTDFLNQRVEWSLNFAVLHEDEYNAIKDVYDSQFSTGNYPVLVLDYYGINTPVRMTINEKDIRKDGCQIRNVNIRLTKRTSVGSPIS